MMNLSVVMSTFNRPNDSLRFMESRRSASQSRTAYFQADQATQERLRVWFGGVLCEVLFKIGSTGHAMGVLGPAAYHYMPYSSCTVLRQKQRRVAADLLRSRGDVDLPT